MCQLQSIRTKLLQHISSSSCVSFYKMCSTPREFTGACSSHCVDSEGACISDLLFQKETVYGCALNPLQRVSLSSWRAPPPDRIRIAFVPNVRPQTFDIAVPSTSAAVEKLNILLECELANEDPEKVNILPVTDENSEAWKLVAWNMKGSSLALALHSDLSQLTALVASFLSYETPINRIMTVQFDGLPILLTENECTTLSQGNINGSPRHCSKYINTLQTIANNAFHQNDTEVSSIQNHVNCTQESIPPNSKLNGSTESILNGASRTHESISETVPNGSNCASASNSNHSTPKKSQLKLELNHGSKEEKKKFKPLKISKIEGMDKNKPLRIDEPISAYEKYNKGGASCPSLPTAKPPNILIYSESAVTRENISKTLKNVLDPDRYAIYSSGDESKLEAAGSNGAVLLIVGGALTPRASTALLTAFLGGASILSLCSDLLISVLPFYQTAEVRERELVSFTYENWKSVKLLHNVFCYQASPARRQFSSGSSSHPSEYKGHGGHNLRVKILAAEQTWHTPSLLRATDDESGGSAVFSQVHLELDSREYLGNDAITAEKARLGVLRKILDSLGLITAPSPMASIISSEPCYTPAYFLGTYELKQEAAESVAVGSLQIVLPKSPCPTASATLTPLLLHACPENFSTLIYFQDLNTKNIGRLVIYSEILMSTQNIINEQIRAHGLVVIADRQTKGHGRGGTIWLSPPGCVMFSVQMITDMSNIITSRPALMQHITALACVSAVRSLPGYENLDLRIKWPNDIYYGKNVKLGGIVVNTTVLGNQMVFNIGIGFNLDNKMPTHCLNDIIIKHNKQLGVLQREKFIALMLNSLECIYEKIKATNDFEEFYKNYYKYWIHSDQEVLVVEEGVDENIGLKCRILGIDENGFLEANGPFGKVVLRPDGNTFDMMKGLIAPKLSS